MLVVVLLLPLSSPMYEGEFAHGGGGGGCGGPAAAVVAAVAAVAAVAMTSIRCSVKSGKQDFLLGGDWRSHALSHHSRHA